jgi:iron(II)-dependent oxidoreductase
MTALFLAVALTLSAGPAQGPGATEARARAEAAAREAREKRERAYETLAGTYALFEAWFVGVREDRGASMRSILEKAAREAHEATVQEGETPSGTSGRSRLRTRLSDSLPAAGIPPVVAPLLATRLAGELAAELESPAPRYEEAARRALESTVDLDRPFHESWNSVLYREVPAAVEFARVEEELSDAMKELSRILRPDRFHPAYGETPPGMILVPGGTYVVGQCEGWDLDTERTKKTIEVRLHTYYIDRTEVTNRRFGEFLDSLQTDEKLRRAPSTWPKDADGKPFLPPELAEHPVAGVSADDALAFAEWAGCRLPTEDEWEVAARGREFFHYPWGQAWEPGRTNCAGQGPGTTSPVGSFSGDRSPFGAYDLAGNVMEWTGSFPDGRPLTRRPTNVNVILRGGSFLRPPANASAAFRWAYPALTTREADLGFRCARDAPER